MFVKSAFRLEDVIDLAFMLPKICFVVQPTFVYALLFRWHQTGPIIVSALLISMTVSVIILKILRLIYSLVCHRLLIATLCYIFLLAFRSLAFALIRYHSKDNNVKIHRGKSAAQGVPVCLMIGIVHNADLVLRKSVRSPCGVGLHIGGQLTEAGVGNTQQINPILRQRIVQGLK